MIVSTPPMSTTGSAVLVQLGPGNPGSSAFGALTHSGLPGNRAFQLRVCTHGAWHVSE